METLDAVRWLTRFDLTRSGGPPPRLFQGLDWRALAEQSVAHGLGALVAYTLEYRLGRGTAPAEIHDHLLGCYQGTMNDNVFKLVSARQLLSEFDHPFAVIGGPAFVDAVYPHVAFRPIPEIPLLLARDAFFALAARGQQLGYELAGTEGRATVLSDTKNRLLLYDAAALFGPEERETPLFERATPLAAFGSRALRLSSEDQLLAQVARMAEAGLDGPAIEVVDLRELVMGAPHGSLGVWAVPDAARVLERAEVVGLVRALYGVMRLTARLFPEAAAACEALTPRLSLPVRMVLDRVVVGPLATLDRAPESRGVEIFRRTLVG